MVGWTSPTHIVLLLLIALLLFGAKRLPEIGRSLGHGMREFKDSVADSGQHERHISQAVLAPGDDEKTRDETFHTRETV
jgi:TatA/E family protein of Tat protein translocase